MTKDEALDLALEALESGDGWRQSDAITAIKQARALDKKADNARELGLDYEPAKKQRWAVFCRVCKKEWSVSYQHPGKSICADCDDALLAHLADHSEQYLDMVKARTAPVQEPVGKVIASVPHLRSISVELLPEAPIPSEDSLIYTTPPAAQPAPVQEHITDGSPCWCEPETSYTDPETGASVIVHREPQ